VDFSRLILLVVILSPRKHVTFFDIKSRSLLVISLEDNCIIKVRLWRKRSHIAICINARNILGIPYEAKHKTSLWNTSMWFFIEFWPIIWYPLKQRNYHLFLNGKNFMSIYSQSTAPAATWLRWEEKRGCKNLNFVYPLLWEFAMWKYRWLFRQVLSVIRVCHVVLTLYGWGIYTYIYSRKVQ
jgi:hypothetical protein